MTRASKRRADASFAGRTVALDWPTPGVARLMLARPAALNAIDITMIGEIGEALDRARQAGVRVLVVGGQGRSFCVGADLKLLVDRTQPVSGGGLAFRDGFLEPLAMLLDRFEEAKFPVIAAIQGHALGGGCELALSADIRLMARDAVLGLPEVKLGAIAGAGGVQKLIRHVGRSKALEWILLGSTITAAEAERFGLVAEVTTGKALMTRALSLAERICALGPTALAQAKRCVYLSEDSDLRTARRFGIEALAALSGSSEWREGLRAFVEKRAPAFTAGMTRKARGR